MSDKVDIQFAIVPVWLLRCGVSDGAVRLYAELAARFADGDGGESWAGIEYMAEICQKSEKTIRRHITELVDAGAVSRQRRLGTSTLTRIHRVPPHFGHQRPNCAVIDGLSTSVTDDRLSIPSNYPDQVDPKKEEVSPSPATELDNDFDEFYRAFPLRRKPHEAKAKYRAARKSGATHAEIMAGIGPYIKDVERQREEGFPQLKWQAPASWLYQGRWKDEYDVPQTDTDERRRIEKARRMMSADQRAAAKSLAAYPYDNDSARIMGESKEVEDVTQAEAAPDSAG